MENLLDIQELSKKLKVKPSTIYGWVHEGYIPHIKLGRLVRFSERKVEEWLKEKEHKGRKQRVPEINLNLS